MESFIFNPNETPEQAMQRKKQRVAQAMMGVPAAPPAPFDFGDAEEDDAPAFSGQTRSTLGGGLGGAMIGGAIGGPVGLVAGALLGGGAARALHKPDPSQQARGAMNAGWDGFSQQPQQSFPTPQSPPAFTPATGNKSIGAGATQTNGPALDFTAAFRKLFGN